MVDTAELLADLDAESAEVDALVAGLSDVDWARPTPAAGWTIAHQIAHLSWTDHAALLAATDEDAFAIHLMNGIAEPLSMVDRGAEEYLAPPPELLSRWRSGRQMLHDVIADVPPGARLPWYGTAMSANSMVTARLMETWAHGLDIAEALGVTRAPTARLRHIAYLGFRTLGNGFSAHGRDVPAEPVRVELSTPDGRLWTFGPDDARNRLVGPALDFCLLVTQRRHPADLALTATGPVAAEWLTVAQVFAGPPGAGREPTTVTPA